MKTVIANLSSIAPYSQSKHYEIPEDDGESKDAHYRRTWRNHMHMTPEGDVFIPPGSFKNCLSESAKYGSITIPGKGKATYTKNFEAGVLVIKPAMIGVKAADVECEALFLPSDGRRGGSKRVLKYYPRFPSWKAIVEFMVIDETVLQPTARDKSRTVFEQVLEEAGQFIGIGRFRPRNNGWYGRFRVDKVEIVNG
jgi:hypothetical protein